MTTDLLIGELPDFEEIFGFPILTDLVYLTGPSHAGQSIAILTCHLLTQKKSMENLARLWLKNLE